MYLPHLHLGIRVALDFTLFCRLILPRMPDAVSIRQINALPPASFGFHLAVDTLAFGYVLGATSCTRDFHPLERAHAERTEKKPPPILLWDRVRLDSQRDRRLLLERAILDAFLGGLVHVVLHVLAGLEVDGVLGRHFDRLARAGVAAEPCGTQVQVERAEAADLDAATGGEAVAQDLQHHADGIVGVLLREARDAFVDGFDQIGAGNSGHDCFSLNIGTWTKTGDHTKTFPLRLKNLVEDGVFAVFPSFRDSPLAAKKGRCAFLGKAVQRPIEGSLQGTSGFPSDSGASLLDGLDGQLA